jgi:hypothetical protein
LAGVNFMLHACGWLEGGLVSSYEKFVMDADQLGTLHHLAQGVSGRRERPGMDAIREVGPGGHYLGCAHTQANFKTAFWRSDLLDYKPFETWDEEGAATPRRWRRAGEEAAGRLPAARDGPGEPARRWRPSWPAARPRCPTPSSDAQVSDWRRSRLASAKRAISTSICWVIE